MGVRLATVADVPAMAEMRWAWRVDEERSGGDAIESQTAFVERFSAFAVEALAGRWTAWVADHEGELVANVWICRIPKIPSPGVTTRDLGYMTNVYTVPPMRNAGVGTQLLSAATAWAHDHALELIFVWPSERSVPLYARAGFSAPDALLTRDIAGYEG